eukprot:jgi/Mesvir1/4867/Mv11139-RA.2
MAGQAKDADLGAMDYVHKIMGYVTGAVALNMARTALELGVFDALSACYGPASAEAIASKLDPPANARLVKELLLGLSASNIIACRDFKAGLFEHTDASRMCWTNEASSPMFLGGLPDMVVELAQREVHAKQLASFRRIDNPGLSYNDQGDGVAKAIGRLLGPWIRSLLVPTLRELLPEIITQLEAGAVVGDIGCGTWYVCKMISCRLKLFILLLCQHQDWYLVTKWWDWQALHVVGVIGNLCTLDLHGVTVTLTVILLDGQLQR